MSFIPRINKVYKDVTFTNEEIRRYGRHLIMPEVTLEGQQKLKAARVIVIGTGGLGRMFEAEHLFDAIVPELVLWGLKHAEAINREASPGKR